jgi:hypothetical protein
MVGPLGVLPVGPAASTIEDEEDIDGGPPWGALLVGPTASTTEVEEDSPLGGRYRWVRRWPPPRMKTLKKTSMKAPLRVSRSHSVSKHTSIPAK